MTSSSSTEGNAFKIVGTVNYRKVDLLYDMGYYILKKITHKKEGSIQRSLSHDEQQPWKIVQIRFLLELVILKKRVGNWDKGRLHL